MESVLVDGEFLALALPEGFQSIPHGELEALMGIDYDCMWGARDTVRHMLISVTWKDSNKLASKLVSEKGRAKQAEETYAKRYHKHGYRCDGFIERAIAGASAPAHGFRFSYTVEGVAQEGEVLVFKRGIRCYTLYYYTRSEAAEENARCLEAILEALEVR